MTEKMKERRRKEPSRVDFITGQIVKKGDILGEFNISDGLGELYYIQRIAGLCHNRIWYELSLYDDGRVIIKAT